MSCIIEISDVKNPKAAENVLSHFIEKKGIDVCGFKTGEPGTILYAVSDPDGNLEKLEDKIQNLEIPPIFSQPKILEKYENQDEAAKKILDYSKI